MITLARRVCIDAPPEKVWSLIADFGSVWRWAPTVREAICTTTADSGIGCARSVTTSGGTTILEVITAWDEGRMFAFDVPAGIPPMVAGLRETWSVDPDGTGCEVVVRMDVDPSPGIWTRLLARSVVLPTLGRMLARNLRGLKRFAEGSTARSAEGE